MASYGSLVHFSIPTADIASAVIFYGELFGWKFQKMTESYWLIENGIGSLSLEKEAVSGTMPIMYFSVQSIEEGLSAVTRLGGRVIVGKTDAGDGKSDFATASDLSGNVIGLWAKRID